MTGAWHVWRTALLTLLALAITGCRPLLTTPPGCEEGATECEPSAPGSAAEVRLVTPASLRESTGTPPLFGRFLPVALELSRSGGAWEVELLCGDRRLATWWPDEEESATLEALVDLLACRSPGTSEHPLPVTLSVMVEDALGARHAQGAFDLLVDFTVEEGELEAPGDPGAPASARVELVDGARTADGVPVLLRVDGLLAQPPEVRLDGMRLEVWPVRDGWRFFVQPPDFSADIDAYELDVEVQVRLTTGFDVTSLVHKRIRFERALRTVPLEGDLFSPFIPKPAGWPVMTPEGLLMVLEDTQASWGARWLRIPADPDQPTPNVTFSRDFGGGQFACSQPGDPVDPATSCILGMNGRGQLVVRRPQPAPLNFLLSVVAADAADRWTPETRFEELLRPAVADPAPFSQPGSWARLEEGRLCAEARTASCSGLPCGPFDRACVLESGAIESVPPIIPPHTSFDAGSSSRALGAGPYFATYDHTFSFLGGVPLLTLGTVTEGQRALGDGSSTIWSYQRGLTALIPVRDGFALLSHGGHMAFYPGALADREEPYSGAWEDGRYGFYTLVHIEPDGALIVLGEDANGDQLLSRWRPEASEPEVVQELPHQPGVYEGVPSASLDLIEDGYSQTFPDGSAALVFRTGDYDLPYRLVVVDPQLRPVLRRRSARPMRATLGPDGKTLWLIESAPDSPGSGNQILILPR